MWSHETAAIVNIVLVLVLCNYNIFFCRLTILNSRNECSGCLHVAAIQWSSQLLTDVEEMFCCYLFLLFIVEAEILRAICVYVYNNFLFLRTLHFLASLARRNTNCSVSCFFSSLYSLYNPRTLPPSRSAWFSKLGWKCSQSEPQFWCSFLCQANRWVSPPPPKGSKSERCWCGLVCASGAAASSKLSWMLVAGGFCAF